MRLQDLFDKWNLTGLKVKTPVMEMEWHPSEPDNVLNTARLWGI